MSYGIGDIVVNKSLTPFGGFVDSSGAPLYKTPTELAAAVNANYQAQGVAARVSSDQMQQYFKATSPVPLSNVPSADYVPPAAHTNPPPAASMSTNALATMNSYSNVPAVGQDPMLAAGWLQNLQDAVASTVATGSTATGMSSSTMLLIGVGVVALMMMGGGGKGKHEEY